MKCVRIVFTDQAEQATPMGDLCVWWTYLGISAGELSDSDGATRIEDVWAREDVCACVRCGDNSTGRDRKKSAD